MGVGISTIVDVVILATSITVQVTVRGNEHEWESPLHCAAFRAPSTGSKFNWNRGHTERRWLPAGGGSYVMPTIERDFYGMAITSNTRYVVKCGVDPDWAFKKYLKTEVKTLRLSPPPEPRVRKPAKPAIKTAPGKAPREPPTRASRASGCFFFAVHFGMC
eukprot:TRINITY_DN2900_c4_g1_i1.p1 TRINITY_DN2900_c4_g1~~TRINITY_DN2900_c4_g1_i1.p1  ORF type:complete len:161 (+),score=16.52 TRINITY_DN2900_c4_g1_i1:69-551(+)